MYYRGRYRRRYRKRSNMRRRWRPRYRKRRYRFRRLTGLRRKPLTLRQNSRTPVGTSKIVSFTGSAFYREKYSQYFPSDPQVTLNDTGIDYSPPPAESFRRNFIRCHVLPGSPAQIPLDVSNVATAPTPADYFNDAILQFTSAVTPNWFHLYPLLYRSYRVNAVRFAMSFKKDWFIREASNPVPYTYPELYAYIRFVTDPHDVESPQHSYTYEELRKARYCKMRRIPISWDNNSTISLSYSVSIPALSHSYSIWKTQNTYNTDKEADPYGRYTVIPATNSTGIPERVWLTFGIIAANTTRFSTSGGGAKPFEYQFQTYLTTRVEFDEPHANTELLEILSTGNSNAAGKVENPLMEIVE